MFLGAEGTALLGIWPAVNAAALGMLLVVPPPVEDLASLLGGEVLLTLHGLGLRSLAVNLLVFGRLLGRTLASVPAALVPIAFVHGFRHYIVSGENHAI
mgnify:CR=1 FL=1